MTILLTSVSVMLIEVTNVVSNVKGVCMIDIKLYRKKRGVMMKALVHLRKIKSDPRTIRKLQWDLLGLRRSCVYFKHMAMSKRYG